MAEAPRYSNVIVSSTDGDTITGPLSVTAIKTIGGGSGITFNLKNVATNVIYSAKAGANAEIFNQFDPWQLRSEVYTVNISAGSGTIYIYIE